MSTQQVLKSNLFFHVVEMFPKSVKYGRMLLYRKKILLNIMFFSTLYSVLRVGIHRTPGRFNTERIIL
jgi:hypothetical protein